MKILIVGGGLSGCSMARLLKDRGHDVNLIEKKDRIGGLCVTDTDIHGLKYEIFGARTFHSNNEKVIEFAKRFSDFNNYIHRKGMIIDDKLFPFPLTKQAIDGFEDKEQILKELSNRPKEIDKTNFETACISIFGETLYNYFIKNYTERMWGKNPKYLTAEWAPKRLELREDDKEGVFAGQWQGLPVGGYSEWLERMIDGIKVTLKCKYFESDNYDVVISTAPIDEIMRFKFGELGYRSLKFRYKQDEEWENDNYGTINLPQHEKYIRKCNFKILHQQESEHNLIQYQEACDVEETGIPMYCVNTEKNEELFDKYLQEICKTPNMFPLGRLGLYCYLDMDKAIEMAMNMVGIVENYLNLNSEQRYNEIKKIRDKY